jgi:hypothetical protein
MNGLKIPLEKVVCEVTDEEFNQLKEMDDF